MSLARVFSGLWPAPDQRSPPSVRGRRAVESTVVAGLGWAGGLSFVALILSAVKEASAADPDLALFDDASITYKGFEHGTFELVTKEAVPRHIIVDDPGQTVVLSKTGSSVSFAQIGEQRVTDGGPADPAAGRACQLLEGPWAGRIRHASGRSG